MDRSTHQNEKEWIHLLLGDTMSHYIIGEEESVT
jgi:hypothetical protein